MARKAKEETASVVVVSDTPDPALFVWNGVEYDLRDFHEFRYFQNHDKNRTEAKFLRPDGGETLVSVGGVDEARQIEAAVNPFWGRR